MEDINYLSKNIRFLRKENRMSQQALAEELEVKRSNIAAYETKNVEPKLSLIYKIAQFFDVSLSELIGKDIEELGSNRHRFFESDQNGFADGIDQQKSKFKITNLSAIEDFRNQSLKIRKMLEGFRVFYQFKKELLNKGPQERRIQADVENFLIFIDHMLQYNENVIDLIGRPDESRKPQGEEDIQGQASNNSLDQGLSDNNQESPLGEGFSL